jgi:hypothetical protein
MITIRSQRSLPGVEAGAVQTSGEHLCRIQYALLKLDYTLGIMSEIKASRREVDMKEDQQLERLDQLKRLLPQQPSGRLAEGTASEVESLLIGCWQLLGGFKQESTSADKLFGRMENIRWEPPYVMFQIERHGGTVMGSSRAEIHDWSVNLETATASCSTGRFRQLRPHAAALDVAPLVEKVAQGIDAGESSPDLKWLAPDRVRVNIGQIIPDNCPKQTLQGRRRRFKQTLEPRLAQLGWYRLAGTAASTYQRKSATSGAPVG